MQQMRAGDKPIQKGISMESVSDSPSWGPAVQEAVEREQAKVLSRWPGPRLETIALVRHWIADGLVKP